MIQKCMKIELKKAFFNKAMLLVVIFTTLLSLAHVVEGLKIYESFVESFHQGDIAGNPMLTAISVFVRWMGADGASFKGSVFFFLLPLFVMVPYGWSLVNEIQSGYTKNLLGRVDRKVYFISKYIAVFLSAALVVIAALLLNFIILSMFLPALKPDSIYPYGTIGQKSMWADLYYEKPLLYTLLYILLDGIFAGLIASLSTALAFFMKRKVAVLLIPFLGMLFVDYINMNIGINCEFSILKFLHLLPVIYDRNGFVIFLEGAILFLITLGLVVYKGKRYEAL